MLIVDAATAKDRWPGAVDLLSREDLVAMLGTEGPSGQELRNTAGVLQALVDNRGP